MAKFRVGDHEIKIKTGDITTRPKIPLQEKICTLCHLNSVEDELHFLNICPINIYGKSYFLLMLEPIVFLTPKKTSVFLLNDNIQLILVILQHIY